MKIVYNYSIALVLLCFVNCSTKKELYQINCVSIENEGYVKLKITNLINPLEYQIENFKKIESNFFSNKGIWKTFIRNATNEQNTTGFEIMINKDQLRKYLEEKQIIKSLNNGF
jgi:hypothetical protein